MATLVIETGAVIANANSYISDADLTTYAADYGFLVGEDEATRITQTLKAMRYVESLLQGNVQGTKVDCNQPLTFPRCHVIIDNCTLADDVIPQILKNAVIQTVVAIQAGLPLWPKPVTETAGMGSIKKKVLGPMTKEYHATNSYSHASANHLQPIQIAEVLQFLNPLLANGGGSGLVRTRRA